MELRLLPLLEWDWTGYELVTDVGGGDGTLLATLLARHDHLRGRLLELADVIPEAAGTLARVALTERTELVAGDFFEGVPAGADIYVLAQILHDWPDDRALDILRSCRRAVPAHGRLLILEQVLAEPSGPDPAALLDLHMLVLLGGRERREQDWRALLSAGGFRIGRLHPGPRSTLIEAVPA